jgi:protein O-GlcNAc transferase
MSLSDPTAASVAAAHDHQRAGQLDQAERLCQELLAKDPNNAQAQHRLAAVWMQQGKSEAAAQMIARALAGAPNEPQFLWTQGLIMAQLRRWDAAIKSHQRLLSIAPAWPGGQCALGVALASAQQIPQAVAAFRVALAQRPDDALALTNLGRALHQIGKTAEAIPLWRRACQLKPAFADAGFYLGNALAERQDENGAIAAWRDALSANPDHHAARRKLATLLSARGEYAAAEAEFRQAIAHHPDDVELHNEQGRALGLAGRVDEALAHYQQGLKRWPTDSVLHTNIANIQKDMGLMDQAMASYRRAVELDRSEQMWLSNLAYAIYFDPGADSAAILRENRRWNQLLGPAQIGRMRPHDNAPDPERRLRIGYLSPDFCAHVVGWNITPLIREHDHQRHEVFCYASVARPDLATDRFKTFADHWRDIANINDDQAADLIRADHIDVLVDLAMHMAGARPRVFVQKPAPVQVAFAAYPGTTGIANMDYRLSDPYLDPPDSQQRDYTERSILLPHSFWCYNPAGTEPPVNDLPALAAGYVTFGCLNNFCKVSDQSLDLWSRVLNAVPNSCLLLQVPEGSPRQRVTAHLAKNGIDPARIGFVPFQLRGPYMQTYHRIDLGLDTLPYNGHTTSLDGLWMGVPTITQVGRTVVGRAGLSQLSNLNLQELVAQTADDFVRIAVELANDLPRLRALRLGLRDRMLASPLTNSVLFARNIESAYRWMWRTWCKSRRG